MIFMIRRWDDLMILQGKKTHEFFQESDDFSVHIEVKGNGVDVAPIEIWRINENAIVTVSSNVRDLQPPKEKVEPVLSTDDNGEWYCLPRGLYEAVIPRVVIPADVVILALPRSTFNRLHGYHMLPTALWDSGFAARGTLSFEVRVKELRVPVRYPLFQLVAFQAEQVPEAALYNGHWQEKKG
jgi:deoxycytidine triphosphate deaminase